MRRIMRKLEKAGKVEIGQKEVGKRRQQHGGPIGGGLPFKLLAQKELADMLLGAVKDVKRRLAEKES